MFEVGMKEFLSSTPDQLALLDPPNATWHLGIRTLRTEWISVRIAPFLIHGSFWEKLKVAYAPRQSGAPQCNLWPNVD